MFTTRFARATLALAGLFAFTIWLPIAVITYLPGWTTLVRSDMNHRLISTFIR